MENVVLKNRKMKTLFITFSYLKGDRGGIYASKTHINLFAELSEKMTLLFPYKKGMEPEDIRTERIKMVPVEDARGIFRKYVDLCLGIQHRYERAASEYLGDCDIDTVVFDGSVTSSRLIGKFKEAGKRVITLHHNYEIEYIKADASPLLKVPQLFWTYLHEGEAVRKSDLNITLSKQDSELFRKHYCKDATFDFLGVYDFKRRSQQTFSERGRGHHYLITGGLGSKQNEDSLIPWIKNYYPILKRIDPEVNLTLAGRSPSPLLKEAVREIGANLIDSPKDMNPILLSGDYYLCPTDRGGGIKLRVMDGLKGGMPVLTHEVSARGYENVIELGIVFSYRDEQSFENALKKMLSSNLSRKEIQDQYLYSFSYEKGLSRLQEILENAQIL